MTPKAQGVGGIYRDGTIIHSQISKEMEIFFQKPIEHLKLDTPTLKSI